MNPRPEPSPLARRYRLLDGLRPHSRESTRKCRRVRISPSVQVQRRPDGGVALAGTHTCGGVRDCPVCAAKIYAERGGEISQALRLWSQREGARSYMLTLTVKHGQRDSLRRLRTGLALAWRYFWQGRTGQAMRHDLRIAHYIRHAEQTHGEHGWHPHLHVVLLTTRKLGEHEERFIAERWQDSVQRALGIAQTPDLAHGAHLTDSFARDYLTKLGLEIAAISSKEGRNGSRTPWQIAEGAARGVGADIKLWRQYCEEMRGARQLTWSRGCRRFFGLGRELSDDELASDGVPVVEGVGHVLGEFRGSDWDSLVRLPGFVASVLEAATSAQPITELMRLGCSNLSPHGRVFGEATREPSDSERWTWKTSQPPYSICTARNLEREEPPDQAPSSDRESLKRWNIRVRRTHSSGPDFAGFCTS